MSACPKKRAPRCLWCPPVQSHTVANWQWVAAQGPLGDCMVGGYIRSTRRLHDRRLHDRRLHQLMSPCPNTRAPRWLRHLSRLLLEYEQWVAAQGPLGGCMIGGYITDDYTNVPLNPKQGPRSRLWHLRQWINTFFLRKKLTPCQNIILE